MSSQDDQSFEAALAAFEAEQDGSARADLRVGQPAEGVILSIEDEVTFVDLGGKAEGQVRTEELCDEEGTLRYAVGDTVEGLLAAQDPDGGYVLRVGAGHTHGAAALDELRAAHQHQLPVEGRVAAINKGGAEVDVGGVRAFCPVSQLADRFVEDPNEFLERKLQFRVTRFEEGGAGRRANVVLSRRALLEEEKRKRAEETRAKLEVGARLTGEVTSIVPFGAFVDVGGIEGLLHVSQMSHSRVDDPSEVVSVGQRLEVEVVSIEDDPKAGDGKGKGERIGLSIRSLLQDPWSGIEDRLPIGSLVAGKVTRTAPFGAFVELPGGLEGLVHVSELGAEQRVQHASEVVSKGQEVEVKVLDVDTERQRISLSIAAAAAAARSREESAIVAEEQRSNAARGSGLGTLGEVLEKARRDADDGGG